MKNWKRLPALLLSLVLTVSLCACGDPTEEPSGGSASPDPSAASTIEVDLSKDIIAFSSGLSGDEVLLTVNGEDIPANLFLYLLYLNCDYLLYQYYYYYGFVPDSLEPAAESLMNSAVNLAQTYAVTRQKAAELGCLLTDEQRAEADAAMMEGGQSAYDENKTYYGLSDSSVDFVFTMDYYYSNVMEATISQPTADELNDYVYQVKHILLMTVDTSQRQDDGSYLPLDEETVAAQKALAEDILAQLQAVEGEEQLRLFDELMNQYSEDTGLDYYPDGYEYTIEDSLVDGFTETALSLKSGEISGILETDYGCHILLRGDLEFREATAEEYTADYRDYLFRQLLNQWTDEANTVRSALLTDLDVNDFFWRYIAYQDALLEQNGDG